MIDAKHEAIYELYPNVVHIIDDVAYDSDGNIVELNDSNVTAKQTEIENAEPLRILRAERNTKLAETDWWDLPTHAPMSAERTAYRQALRDITDTYTSLDDVVWPTKPE